MTEIRSQIFFGDLRLKNELHYNGDSRARRLCLELRRMISATSFSLTHSPPPPHLLTSFSLSHSLSPPWIQPPSPHYLTLSLSLTLVVSFSWSFSLFHFSFLTVVFPFLVAPFPFGSSDPNSGLSFSQTLTWEYNCSSIFVALSKLRSKTLKF